MIIMNTASIILPNIVIFNYKSRGRAYSDQAILVLVKSCDILHLPKFSLDIHDLVQHTGKCTEQMKICFPPDIRGKY